MSNKGLVFNYFKIRIDLFSSYTPSVPIPVCLDEIIKVRVAVSLYWNGSGSKCLEKLDVWRIVLLLS